MRALQQGFWAACVALAALAPVAPAAAADAPAVVNGVRLARLCDRCGVVTQVKATSRKGDASGVGAVGGAVAGGVIGKKTTDSTLGTAGGAVVGGLLGHEIEKRVKGRSVWETKVTLKNGSVRRFDTVEQPSWRAGTVVEVTADDRLKRH
jgi:outer membrane lipoprotein SlyB